MTTTTITCHKCNHEWNTKSTIMWVTCPSCQYKTKNGGYNDTNQSTPTSKHTE